MNEQHRFIVSLLVFLQKDLRCRNTWQVALEKVVHTPGNGCRVLLPRTLENARQDGNLKLSVNASETGKAHIHAVIPCARSHSKSFSVMVFFFFLI